MLIKIKDDWVDPAEIAAAQYAAADKMDPERYFVTLRSGGDLCLYCSPGELEAALVRAGVAVYSIQEAQLQELVQLYNAGYRYLARNGGGALFAYRNEPQSDGYDWYEATEDDGETLLLCRESFLFVGSDDEKPFDIAKVVGGHAEV